MYDNNYKNQEGSIMVISVLIMSIMSVVVFALSTLLMRQIDFSQNLDNATLAYYGAESSMEEALYDARKQDIVTLEQEGEFTNNVTWKREITPVQENIVYPKIEKNTFIELDLFDVEDPSCSSFESTGVACNWESMNIDWEGAGSIQLTITSWETAATIDVDPENIEEDRYISASSPWLLNDLQAFKNYRIKIKALYDTVENVTVTLYDEDNASGSIVSIPNFLTITGQGSYRKNKQALRVRIPRQAPLSSLFDFVIFSEDDIVKEL